MEYNISSLTKPDYYIVMTQLTFTRLNSTIETLEKVVKYVTS